MNAEMLKRTVAKVGNYLGYSVVRQATLENLLETSRTMQEQLRAPEVPAPSPKEIKHLEVRQGEESVTIPAVTLQTLLRESQLLRDQAGEIARLKRRLEIMSAGQSDDLRNAIATEPQTGMYTPIYDYDGLRSDPQVIHNHDFMKDPYFMAAYGRGIQAVGFDYKYYWRVHVALWCAKHALSLDGDFIECGVWKGMLSSAIMEYLNWNDLNRRFVLFDTYRGIDERQITDEEILKGNIGHFRAHYHGDFYEDVVTNFSEFNNVEIVRGSVPETLGTVKIDKVCYLSIDMNNSAPEIAAATYFWDKLVPGAMILLDDYGFVSYEVQKQAFDKWAAERGVEILALPTGQGLILKPGAAV